MSLRLQVVIAIGALIAILYIGNLVRIRRLELKYALIWFFVGLLLLIFDLFPGLLTIMSQTLGITTSDQYADIFGTFVCPDDYFQPDDRYFQSDQKV